MRALVFDGELRVRDVPRPRLRPGEAIIRPRLAGVCATDLELARGYKRETGRVPRIFGHEFVGDVAACDDYSWIGRRVVGEINAACGACRACLCGARAHCPERTTLGINGRDGAFAELLALPVANLHPVPDVLPAPESLIRHACGPYGRTPIGGALGEVTGQFDETVSRLRPLARRRFNTIRPFLVRIRTRNPCVRRRRRLLG